MDSEETLPSASAMWDVHLKDGRLLVKYDGNEIALTKTGDRKFTFGLANENELVFVPGKSGKISFLFSELYAAKRVETTAPR